VTGLPQQIPAETIGACLGDALLAAEALGMDASRGNPIAATVAPDPGNHKRYEEFYRHYRSLYDATAETAHFLADQQKQG
jgi:xylulokinase